MFPPPLSYLSERERERKRSHPWDYSPKCSRQPKLGQAEAGSQERNPAEPAGMQLLEPSLAAFRVHSSRKLELEGSWSSKPGTQIWDVGIPCSILTARPNAHF